MNILIFEAHYIPYMGGIENYTLHLQRKLIEDGHHVTIVTSQEMGLSTKDIDDNGCVIYRLPSFLPMNGRYPITKRYNHYTKAILRQLSRQSYDLCLVNTRFYIISLIGIKFGIKKRIHTIVIDHGTSHLSVHNKILDWMGEKWEHHLTNIGMKYKPDYGAVSMASIEWLKHFNISGKYIFYNAIDPQEIEEARQKKIVNYRMKFNVPEDAAVVSFTGRMLEEKGIPQLLQAAEELHKENYKVHFFLAGDGPLLDMAERETKDKEYIHVLGRLDKDHIIALLDSSDIFCLPSFSEGFSTSILEAAACHAYIITTFRGGSKELVCDPKYGCIIKDNSIEMLLPALKNAIEHPTECKEAAEACYNRVMEKFTWEQTAKAVEKTI
jgi:glycosyltransferase involved in cell wall biosynthesis